MKLSLEPDILTQSLIDKVALAPVKNTPSSTMRTLENTPDKLFALAALELCAGTVDFLSKSLGGTTPIRIPQVYVYQQHRNSPSIFQSSLVFVSFVQHSASTSSTFASTIDFLFANQSLLFFFPSKIQNSNCKPRLKFFSARPPVSCL